MIAHRGIAAAALMIVGTVGPLAAQQELTLEDAIRTALVQNPSMSAAEAAVSAAAAGRWADWGAFLPTANASASVGRTDFTTVTFQNPDGTTTVLDDPIEDVSKNNSTGLSFGLQLGPDQFINLGAGGARKDAAGFRLAATSREVVRQVKVAYFDALKAQALAGVAERQAEARRQDYEVTRDRYRIAAASRSDLLGAEIDLRNAELRQMDTEDGYVSSLRLLRTRLGQESARLDADDLVLVDPATIPDAAALDADRLVTAARSGNPSLRAALADERAASAGVWSARASYLPTLNFGLSLGRSRQVAADESLFTFSPANTSQGISISASWPLFTGFQRKQRNAEASQQLVAAQADVRAEELQLESEVRNLVDQLRRRSRRLEVLERNAELAGERLDLAREQYRLGSIAYFNLQQAIESLDQAQQSALDERYELLKDWAELEQRVGDASD